MSENVLVVIDSVPTDNLIYGGGPNGGWTMKNGSQWFGNTIAWSGTASGSINVTFAGNSIAFYGHPPPHSQEMTVTIDEQQPYKTSFSADQAGSYCQWWQSPTLDDGTHTIHVDGLTRTSLDFAAVSVNNTSAIGQQMIIVDDNDASMVYKGHWKRPTGPFTSRGGNFWPFHNATHQSDTVNSSVSFQFTGSSIAVYGIMPSNTTGFIKARYTLDSDATTKMHEPSENPPQGRQNFLFYSKDPLDAGQHTLSIEIEDVQNLVYNLDYVVYTQSLGKRPNSTSQPMTVSVSMAQTTSSSRTSLTSPSSTHMSSTSSKMTTSTVSSSKSTDITTEVVTIASTIMVSESESTTSSSATPTAVVTPTAVATPSNNTTLPTGGIVGVAIGGVAILAVLIAAALCWRRRRDRPRHILSLYDVSSSNASSDAGIGKSVGLASSGSLSLTPIEPFTLSHPAPESRAAVESTDSKMASLFSLNPNPNLLLEQFSVLHRRSGSGTTRADFGNSEDDHYTLATSSSTIAAKGKPPTDSKMASFFSLNPNPNFLPEQFSMLHRRSWSGTTRADFGNSSEDDHYTLATSSTIPAKGRPPSYKSMRNPGVGVAI